MRPTARHNFALTNLRCALVSRFDDCALFRFRLSIDAENQLEPDGMVTFSPVRNFAKRWPQPPDAGWLLEVSDSALQFDLTAKATVYARAGVKDYWVLDLVNRRIVVHRQPSFHGYDSVVAYRDTEPIAPLIEPDKPVDFAALTGL